MNRVNFGKSRKPRLPTPHPKCRVQLQCNNKKVRRSNCALEKLSASRSHSYTTYQTYSIIQAFNKHVVEKKRVKDSKRALEASILLSYFSS